jgi:hypothetical protein
LADLGRQNIGKAILAMKPSDPAELFADEVELDEVELIAAEMRHDAELAQRHSRPRQIIPAEYLNTDHYLALTAEEYLSFCDRGNYLGKQKLLVIEPIDAFVYIDRLLPAHIVGIDHSGTSLELYRHRQDILTGIHSLGKITAHACHIKNCQLQADGDSDNMGIYLSDCRSDKCQLQSRGECKIGGGSYGHLEVKSESRIEVISSAAESLTIEAPECHIALRSTPSAQPSTLKIEAAHAVLLGNFQTITGKVGTLVIGLGSLGAWHGKCRQRKIVMSPKEFTAHLEHPNQQVTPSDQIRVSRTRQVLVLEDHHEISPEVEILSDVDISKLHKPWTQPITGILFVSRERKQEITGHCRTIRLAGSNTDLTMQEYQQWHPISASPTSPNLGLELF